MYDSILTKPFGPHILECMCPDDVVTKFNYFVDNMDQETKELCSSKHSKVEGFPDLLSRGFEIVYMTGQQLEDIGFTQFIAPMAKEYLNSYGVQNAQIHWNQSHFSELFVDAWVNRYFEDNYTPPHDHAGNISGITFLELPEESDWYDLHSLEFIWNNQHHRPEQAVGKTLLFDPKLMHWVVKQKCVSERRTLSFNLVVDIVQ